MSEISGSDIKREVYDKCLKEMTEEETRVAGLYYDKYMPLSIGLNHAYKCYRHMGKLEYHLIELGMDQEDFIKILGYFNDIGKIVQKRVDENFEMEVKIKDA